MYKEIAIVRSNKEIARNIFEAILYSPSISKSSKPGQFINILPHCNWKNVMRRPMSIAWQKNDEISIIYKIFGEGTKLISKWKRNDLVDIIGPLGNSWDNFNIKKPILIGGGVGIAPILNLHLLLKDKKIEHILIMGARTKKEHFMIHRPKKNIYLSTDLEEYGIKGNVVFALKKIRKQIKEEIKVFSCGPPAMMKAVLNFCNNNYIDCDIALETIMACGIGICQGCTIVKNYNKGNTYRKKYSLACIDGPIFNIKDLDNAYI